MKAESAERKKERKRSSTKQTMAIDDLTEEERRALRGSKFAPLPSQPPTSSRSLPRLAHPGGPLKTNKAAALAKFLHRKMHQHPGALSSINPDLLELAVRNAKASVLSGGGSGTNIRHVDTFDDPKGCFDEGEAMNSEPKRQKKKNKKKNKSKKNKRQKMIIEESECGVRKKPKKILKL